MIQVTIFAGHEGRLRYDKWFYLTLFAGCDLVRPTVARQLLMRRHAEQEGRVAMRKPFFLTIFGGVDIKSPTLAEEFIDLREMVHGGALDMDDWERAMADLGRADAGIASFTIFGGFDECGLPRETEEIDSLAVQCHVGNISDSARQVLQLGIGQRDGERRAVVRRAILANA